MAGYKSPDFKERAAASRAAKQAALDRLRDKAAREAKPDAQKVPEE